tara:strand:+ start:3438 stop:7349 length:3912 start_codon:yes stop_codon:yes gene_type:complete
MKLFNNQPDAHEYFKHAILNDENELEAIFGYTPAKNPINKKIFINLLEKCREIYETKYEETILDIRTEFKNNVSNVRCSVKGLESIKQYCREDSLENINDENLEYIQKTVFSDGTKKYGQIKDEYYNIRLNLKKEKSLNNRHHFVKSMLVDYRNKRKHFRYKKRYSFLTEDKVFRIDLTVVKETSKYKGKFNFKKTFKEADILKNKEKYEVEIEYVGWEKEVGIPKIDLLYRQLKDDIDPYAPGNQKNGNIYDPLNLGINVPKQDNFTIQDNEDYEYEINSPIPRERFDDDVNTKLISYNDSSIRYTHDDYRTLLGKFTRIKDSYFKENDIDPLFGEALKGYYRLGTKIGLIEDIFEEVNEETNEYIDTKVLVSFTPMIGNIQSLIVPISDLYDGYFTIKEKSIVEGAVINKTFEPISDLFEVPSFNGTDIIETGELTEKLIEILTSHVEYISKLIYNTDTLISYKLKEEILLKYKKVTGQNTWYFNLMGPQPVTLHLKDIKVKSKYPLSVNYAVTEKADGERYQLFITNHNGYLINAKQNVIDTGCHFLDISDDWILDGEYITKDKDNEKLNLYMIFDVYWCGKLTPQPIHTYPFRANDPNDISRSSILNKFRSILQNPDNIIRYDHFDEKIGVLDIDIKTYEYGFQTGFGEDSIDLSEIKKNDIMKIFESSKKILKSDKKGHYAYRTDGLIFLPTNLSVKGEIEGVQKDSIRGSWYQNFKWKPPHENTIDFLVKVKKDLVNGKLRDKVFPQVNHINGSEVINDYKQLELYVGYDFERDPNIDYCNLILNGKTSENKNPDKIQIFNAHSKEDLKYNTTNILLTNGNMLCDNFTKDEIKDGDLVEMRFERDSTTGTYWVPIRIRTDKIDPQDFTIANDVWESINNPVTVDMISGIDKSVIHEEISTEEDGKYYIEKNNDKDKFLESYKLRQLHNYIKSRLIGSVCTSFNDKKIKILDLSCGRGGDNGKYLNKDINTNFYLGIDISSNIHWACRRYYESNKRIPTVFLRGDTSKNIRSGECSEIENNNTQDKKHTEIMTSILYDTKKPIPKDYKNIHTRYKGLASNGFDVVSSQFSMHYYFSSETNFMGFLNNLKDNVKVGGYFIGTCYDGNEIFKYFKEKRDKYKIWKQENDPTSEEDEEEEEDENFNPFGINKFLYKDNMGNLIFSIDATYDTDNFDYDPENIDNMFGVEIDVYMESIGQKMKEYLVNFDFVKDIMKKNGFEVSIPENMNPRYSQILRKDYFMNDLGQFGKVIVNLDQLYRTDSDLNSFYKEAYKMKPMEYVSNPLQVLSSFNTYFIFKRIE